MIAALPMYDLPELRDATDALWAGIAKRMRARGLDAPERLSRDADLIETWLRPDLALSQSCGWPWATRLAGRATLVATPLYAAPGCVGATYSSAMVAHATRKDEPLADFGGARLAFNAPDSWSGLHALRDTLAGAPAPFFGEALETGSHRASLEAVREGRADLCAVDCVTWALLGEAAPAEREDLAVIGWTKPAPALPFIAAGGADAVALYAALAEAFDAQETEHARRSLGLRGVAEAKAEAYSVLPARSARFAGDLVAPQRPDAR